VIKKDVSRVARYRPEKKQAADRNEKNVQRVQPKNNETVGLQGTYGYKRQVKAFGWVKFNQKGSNTKK